MPVLSGGMGQKCPIAIWSLPHSGKDPGILPHTVASYQGRKNDALFQKPCVFCTLPLVTDVIVAKLHVFLDLALITLIMVEYSDDFQGLPHSENQDLPHSAEPKINVCPIAKILKTGID